MADALDALPISLLHAQVEKDRRERSEEHKREVLKRGLLTKKRGEGLLNLYADGDSWFDYPPSTDIVKRIRAGGQPTPLINNQAHHGDSAVERMGLAKRQRLIANLKDPNHGVYDALLFSAGGNDMAGDQFVLWVLDHVAGADPLNGVERQRLAGMLGVVKGAYEDLIAIRNDYDPACAIFFHGYDFAPPNGERVCAGIGPWLQPALNFRGWTDFAQASIIVREVLIAFKQTLIQLAQQHPNVIYVPTQDVLQPNEWANELHPTRDGFDKIAQRFLGALRTKFPDRI